MGFSPFKKDGTTASGFSRNLTNNRINRKLNFAKGKMAANNLILGGNMLRFIYKTHLKYIFPIY
jgi:hypothetical protein